MLVWLVTLVPQIQAVLGDDAWQNAVTPTMPKIARAMPALILATPRAIQDGQEGEEFDDAEGCVDPDIDFQYCYKQGYAIGYEEGSENKSS